MNKFIKTCISGGIIGGIVYAMCDMAYQAGKGRMIGILAKTKVSASQCMDAISDDKRLRVKLVSKVAKFTKEES